MAYKRLFAAIKITSPNNLAEDLLLLKSALNKDKISWINIEQLHLTLHFFGKTDEDLLPKIFSLLNDVANNSSIINLKIKNIGVFGSKYSPKLLWLAVEENKELINLKIKINEELFKKDFQIEALNFRPHITLGRIKKIDDLKYFNLVLDRFRNNVEFSAMIEEFHLFESILTTKCAIHEVLKTFTLK